MEGEVVIVPGVAPKQDGAGVTVEGVVEKPHGTRHGRYDDLRQENFPFGSSVYLETC